MATARRVDSLRRLRQPRRQGSALRRRLDIAADAAGLAARLWRRRGFVWLDGDDARDHLIGFDPLMMIQARGHRTTVSGPAGRRAWRCDGLAALDAVFEAYSAAAPVARMFGYLGYELASDLEQLPGFPVADLPVPDLSMGLHDLWLHGRRGEWYLVGDTSWRSATEIERLAGEIERAAAAPPPPPRHLRPAPVLRSIPDADGYLRAVRRTIDRIGEGEIFEANLCRRFQVEVPTASSLELYGRMRRTGDARYGAFLQAGRGYVLSRSPECFLTVRDGVVRSLPIKGTRPRHARPEHDAQLSEDLLRSEKDQAELAMIVDLVRNDLGRVCEPGSVKVVRHATLMKLETVWHTVSEVEGRLERAIGTVDLLRASFPPGSITGAPKIQAVIVAAYEEPTRRGPAMGSVGWMALDGDLDLSVAIRTAVAAVDRVVYHAGCGIVADSDPQAELDETRAKARVFLEALGR
jgi:para-aminobenzoate synthetase component 1